MKRNLFILGKNCFSLLLVLIAVFGWGQIATLELGTTSYTSNTIGSATFTSKDVNISALPNLILTSAQQGQAGGTGYIASKAWTTSTTYNSANYWEFTISANAGYQLSISSISLRALRNANGPKNIVLASDVDNYSTVIGGVQTVGTSASTITFGSLNLNNKASITFRVYGYSAATATGTLRIGDGMASSPDITVDGSVTSTVNPVDGTINTGEYGTHTDGNNQQTNGGVVTYLKSDATNLYVGVSGGNLAEGFVIYLDRNPVIPVNGGTNADGTLVGKYYDNTNFAELPFRADAVLYVKNNYREFRTADGANGWSAATAGFGSYADNGTNVREFSIPWSSIGGTPTSFNFFSYITSGGGYVYGETPIENPDGNIGTAARNERYFTVTNSTIPPFSRNCYVFNSATDKNNVGPMDVYDFTMNTNRWLSRTGGANGAWNVAGTFLQTQGNIYLGSGAKSLNVAGVTNLQGGSLDFGDITNISTLNSDLNITAGATLKLSNQAGGDLRIFGNWSNAGIFNPNNRGVYFSKTTGNQTITNASGENFAYLIHDGAGTLQMLNDVTVTGNSGDVLQLLAGGFDINGRTLRLSGSGGNIKLNGAQTFAITTGSILNITGVVSAVKTIYGGTLNIPANVTTVLNSGINFGANVTTINGILRIASGGSVSTNPPVYTTGSTLEYNGVSNYGVGAEWTGGGVTPTVVGSGVPFNVDIIESSLNMPNANRGLAGRLKFGTAFPSTSVLNLNATSGDLYLGGSWLNYGGTFNHNNRAVFFTNATSAQTISKYSAAGVYGAETFAYLISTKAAGTIQLFSDVNIVGNGAGALTLRGAGTIDVMDRNLNINGTGSILVDGGIRNIGSSFVVLTAGNLNFNGATSVTSQNSGTLVVDSKVKSYLNNTVNFGSSITTFSGTLFVKPNGTATSAPIYGSSAILEYNGTGNATTSHFAGYEWSGNIAGAASHTFAAGLGLPPTVNIVNSNVTAFPAEVSTNILNIDAASTLNQSPNANYDDIKLFGNLVNNGIINSNNRTFIFQGATNQTISGVDTNFGSVKINNSVSVTTSVNLNLSNTLDLVLGKLLIGTKNVTANTTTSTNYANSYVVTAVTGTTSGQLKLPVSTTDVIFPIGPSTSVYSPITVSNSGTLDTYGFNVKTGVADVITDTEYMVKKSWVVTEAVAGGGNLKVSPQWVTADQGTAFDAADNYLQLYTSPSLVNEYPATVTGTTAVLTNSADNFSDSLPQATSTTYFAVGKHTPQEIDVLGNSVSIANNDTTPSISDDTDFGNVTLGSFVEKTYTIKNLGQKSLNVSNISVTGDTSFTISLVPTLPANITKNQNPDFTFTVRFSPTTAGLKTATVNIDNNDSNENPYVFAVQGNAIINCVTSTTATDIDEDSFTANWDNNVTGATSYVIDVATNPNFEITTSGTITESFDTGLSTSGYYTGNSTLSSGTWISNRILRSSTGNGYILYAAQMEGATGSLTSPVVDNITNLTFRLKKSGSAPNIFKVTILDSSNNEIYSVMNSNPSTFGSYALYNFDIPIAYQQTGTKIRFFNEGSNAAYLDEVKISYSNTQKFYVLPYENYDVANLPADRRVDQNLIEGTTYYYRIRAVNNGVQSANTCNYISVTPTAIVWDGNTWSNGTGPKIFLKSKVIGPYPNGIVGAGSFETKKLTISNTGSLNIQANEYVKIHNELENSGNVLVESDGNLIQDNNDPLLPSNTGSITVNREIKVGNARTQYNYLGSPVTFDAGESFKTIYPGITYVLYHNEANGKFYNSSGANIPGRGLGVKEPTGSGATTVTAQFKGVPQNGVITFPIVNGNTADPTRGFNLAGNPYPSNIDLLDLYDINGGVTASGTESENISSTFYFWDNNVNNDVALTQQGFAYNGQAYAIFNVLSGSNGTGTAAGTVNGGVEIGSKAPERTVKVAQGFMVKSKKSKYGLVYNNDIRTPASAANDFLGKKSITDDRFWLKMIAPSNMTSNIAIVYFAAGKNTFGAEDSESMGGSDELYSIVDGKKVAINTKSSFDNSDVLQLGTKNFANGIYTISLSKAEGVFANGQNVYLRDKRTGTLTNLTKGNYSFTIDAGETTNRFEVIYKEENALGAKDAAQKEEVIVYKDGDSLVVKAQSKKITSIEMFDTSGRLIFTNQPNNIIKEIDVQSLNQGLYILKIMQNNQITVKKILR